MLRSLAIVIGVGVLVLAVGLAFSRREKDTGLDAPVVDYFPPTPTSASSPARLAATRPQFPTTEPVEEGLTALAGKKDLKSAGLDTSTGIAGLLKQKLGQDVDPAKAAAVHDFVAARPYLGKAVRLTLLDERELSGVLLNADPQTVQILVDNELTTVKWNDIQAGSAVEAMKIILAPLNGEKHLNIAQYLLARDEPQLFVEELEQVLTLDPALRPRVNELMLVWQRARDNRFSSGIAGTPISPIWAGTRKGALQPYPPPGSIDPGPYIKQIDQEAGQLAQKSGIRFDRILTDHFLIYHTWGSRSHDQLRLALERMYEAVVRVFGVPGYQNLFAGRCPIYVVTDFNQFRTLCQPYGFTPEPGVLGVTISSDDGSVRMLMYWSGDENRFMQTLVHEGTHAVLHRYRSPVHVDAWLNEGLAEHVTAGQFPKSGKFEQARVYAANFVRQGNKLDALFSADGSPPAPYYPICLSLVEYLMRRDGRSFAVMLAAIKDGQGTEQALLSAYRINPAQLEAGWREWTKSWAP